MAGYTGYIDTPSMYRKDQDEHQLLDINTTTRFGFIAAVFITEDAWIVLFCFFLWYFTWDAQRSNDHESNRECVVGGAFLKTGIRGARVG